MKEKGKKYTVFSNVRYVYRTLYEVNPKMRIAVYGTVFFQSCGARGRDGYACGSSCQYYGKRKSEPLSDGYGGHAGGVLFLPSW